MTTLKQEVFNKVSQHLLAQNKQSARQSEDGSSLECLYRGPEGGSCAIGCLFLNEYYDTSLEGRGVEADVVLDAVQISLGVTSDEAWSLRYLLKDLQDVHDSHSPGDWKGQLELLAEKESLEVNF